MEVKKLAVYGFVAFAVLALAMPAGAWIGPFGGCGLGFGLGGFGLGCGLGLGLGLGCGLGFGPFGPFGPFGLCSPFSYPVPVPVPVPVPAAAVPVPAAVPASARCRPRCPSAVPPWAASASPVAADQRKPGNEAENQPAMPVHAAFSFLSAA